jgi:hypothetical protein
MRLNLSANYNSCKFEFFNYHSLYIQNHEVSISSDLLSSATISVIFNVLHSRQKGLRHCMGWDGIL